MRNILLVFTATLALAAQAPLAFAQTHDHGAHGAAAAVQTTPGDGTMGAAPERFSAMFPHAMRLTSVVVTPQGGDPLSVDLASASAGTTVSAALPRLAPGNYTIAWTASGNDNHTMTGRVRYMVH
ncbi:MAG: copper resistance protein CopC [Alphaproteobacteria bacterium]|nr:copper resistance protein CopC [Alphaproteobacteria bacterium]